MVQQRFLRMVAQNPAHPWWQIAEMLGEALAGFSSPEGFATPFGTRSLRGVQFGLYTPTDLAGALFNPIQVAEGTYDVGITTPSAAAFMAEQGVGPYPGRYEGLRAIAAYPHDDFLVFQIDAKYGVSSLRELGRARPPVTIVTGRVGSLGEEDVLTFTIHEILRQHGFSFADVESWGGRVLFGGPTHVGGHIVRQGSADALFHEAQGQPVWAEIAQSRDMVVLDVDESVQQHMAEKYRLRPRVIPAGHGSGTTRPVPTVDFSGWLVFVREDFPDEWAYALAAAVHETRKGVDDLGMGSSLILPLDPEYLFTETVIPLHDGAARYARDQGIIA
jgi:TRAP-type uncharacterized transport system substrate-binding protein